MKQCQEIDILSYTTYIHWYTASTSCHIIFNISVSVNITVKTIKKKSNNLIKKMESLVKYESDDEDLQTSKKSNSRVN